MNKLWSLLFLTVPILGVACFWWGALGYMWLPPDVSEHGHTIGEGEDFLEPVGNVDDADAASPEIAHHREQQVLLLLRQRRRGFVHDDDSRRENLGGFNPLNHR